MNILDNLKHAVFEEDPEKPVPKIEKPAPTPSTSFGFGGASPFSGQTVVAPDNQDLYNRVFEKTNFDNTQAGAILHKYLAPLDSIPMDPSLKFRTAVAQASAQDGLTPEKILATFDGLKQDLQKEISNFNAALESKQKEEITDRQTEISKITQQMADLQSRLGQLTADLAAAQSKISTTVQQFSVVTTKRGIELDQQKNQYSGMLRG